jgi:hypothetical protein
MPASPSIDVTKFPLSGDVTQAINPWSWMNNSLGQFGYININQTVSSNRSVEQEIVTRAAGYGKQLGRITDVLEVLVKRLPATGLEKDEKKAVADFLETANAIAAVKAGYAAPSQENVDRLIAGIRHLKGKDDDAYRAIVDKLRKELLSETATARLTYSAGAKR